MKNHFSKDIIKKCLNTNEIMKADFGLEREGLRITPDGCLSLSPHPEIFGDKLKNPYITTDFSESQIEMVTPTFNSTKKAHDFLLFLTDTVISSIKSEEYLWNQSLPCILPKSEDVPVAKYGDDEKSIESYEYRLGLAKKYGTKKQLISGIHYNFSFDENTIKKLYEYDNLNLSYNEFKDQIYLKIVRNYLRYKWLVIYLTGCSVSAHETFTCDCINLMDTRTDDEYTSSTGVSFRNASCGYKNLTKLYPRYDTVDNFVEDVQSYIDEGYLSQAKELYTQIRLKSKNPDEFLKSLHEDGILYVELRTVDINTFDECGISLDDMDFLHILMMYLLIKDESDYTKWQEEGLINEEAVSENGFNSNTHMLKDGCEISLKTWANELIDEMMEFNNEFNLSFTDTLNIMKDRINNPEKTHSKRLLKLVEKEGFINSQIKIAKKYKKESTNRINKKDYSRYEKYKKEALLY